MYNMFVIYASFTNTSQCVAQEYFRISKNIKVRFVLMSAQQLMPMLVVKSVVMN